MNLPNKNISVAKQFSRTPGGRTKEDGPFSAEAFRDNLLIPLLNEGQPVTIELDGTLGYASSFLEEVFGGLVRKGYSPSKLEKLLCFKSEQDMFLVKEIWSYINQK